MVSSEIQLFQSLKTKLGENQAKELIEYIDSKTEQTFVVKSENLVTKEDLTREIYTTKQELTREIYNLKSELTTKIYVTGLIQFLTIVSSVIAMIILFIK
jgi:hypothetical protein